MTGRKLNLTRGRQSFRVLRTLRQLFVDERAHHRAAHRAAHAIPRNRRPRMKEQIAFHARDQLESRPQTRKKRFAAYDSFHGRLIGRANPFACRCEGIHSLHRYGKRGFQSSDMDFNPRSDSVS